MSTNLITRGLGSNPSIIGQGFIVTVSEVVATVTEDVRRRRRRGRSAIDEFEEFFIRASLVSVNNKNVESKQIQSEQKARILNENNVSVNASGVKVNYFNSAVKRIVINATRILKG